MEIVKDIEKVLVEQFAKVPFHLPKDARAWLGTNLWLIVLIGIILSVIGIFSVLQLLFFATSIASVYGVEYLETRWQTSAFGSAWSNM